MTGVITGVLDRQVYKDNVSEVRSGKASKLDNISDLNQDNLFSE